MDLQKLQEKWMSFVNRMNRKGIPVPMIRDPKTGEGSLAITLVFISFNVWLVSVVGKAAGALGGVDPTQTFNMFLAACSLYWGRKFQKDEKRSELSTLEEKRTE